MGDPVHFTPLQPTKTSNNALYFRRRNTFLEIRDSQSTSSHLDRHVRARSHDSYSSQIDSGNWFCTDVLGQKPFSPSCGKSMIKSKVEVFNQQCMEEQCMDQVSGNLTTVMLRNIACRYNQDDVSEIFDRNGLKDKYDFIYLPCSPRRSTVRKQSNFGYVFVNFTRPEYVQECRKIFDGRPFGKSGMKLCQVVPAHIQKGTSKYRATPLIRREGKGRHMQIQAAG